MIRRLENWKYIGYAGITVYHMERVIGRQKFRMSVAATQKELRQARDLVAYKLRRARHELRRMVELAAMHETTSPTGGQDERV